MAMRAKRVPVVRPLRSCWRRVSIGPGLVLAQHAHERELPGLHGIAAHGAQGRVSVLVEGPLPERSVEVLDREAAGADRVAVLLPRAADGLEGRLAALVSVHRVALGVLPVLLLVVGDEGRALPRQLLGRQAAEGDE